jgi:hypothetical protein
MAAKMGTAWPSSSVDANQAMTTETEVLSTCSKGLRDDSRNSARVRIRPA